MKLTQYLLSAVLVAAMPLACESETPDSSGDTPKTNQTLVVTGDCTFAACGVVPSSLSTEPKVTCESSADESCTWDGSANDSTSSYRFCSDAECPTKPAVSCPEGTKFASQNCGSENDAPCAWTTTCAPPRETTPCPVSTGCDDLPVIEIGIICSDGTTGAFTCVTDGQKCFWERNCD